MMGKHYFLNQGSNPMRTPFGRHNVACSDQILYQAPVELTVSHLLNLFYWGQQELQNFYVGVESLLLQGVTGDGIKKRRNLISYCGGGIPQRPPQLYNWVEPGEMEGVLAVPCPMHNEAAVDKFFMSMTLDHVVPLHSKGRVQYFRLLEGLVGSTNPHTIVESCSRYRKWLPECHSLFFNDIATHDSKFRRIYRYNFCLASLHGAHLWHNTGKPLTSQAKFAHFAYGMLLHTLAGQLSAETGGIQMV